MRLERIVWILTGEHGLKLHQWIGMTVLAAASCMASAQPTEQAAASPAPTTSTGQVGATDAKTEAVKSLFKERFGNMPVTEVRYGPFGFFEIQLGSSLVYTDETVSFVMDGHLIDAKSRRDLTEDRLEELARIDFDTLPFELAIKQVRGDGSRRMAIFEDPNCGYCKQLRKSLVGIDNLTIYTFMLPILSQDSVDKVANIWCAQDRGAAWDDWMLKGKVPEKKSCDAPIQKFQQLGRELMVQGTPAIFFVDGSRVPGAISKAEIEKRLK